MKNQKGITLIALVITIIVMLILVGVTISVSLNGGLFSTAKEATKETQIAKESEELLMATMGALGENGEVLLSKLDNSLPTGFQTTGETGKYKSPTGNIFTVGTNGTITLVGSSSGEKPETPVTPPVSQEYELSGKWTFNNTVDVQGGLESFGEQWSDNGSSYFYLDIEFLSGSYNYIGMALDYIAPETYTLFYELEDISDPVFRDGSWAMWEGELYRDVDFGTTPQTVPQEFYEWFTANATQVKQISFTIDGTSYSVTEETTWEMWIENGLAPAFLTFGGPMNRAIVNTENGNPLLDGNVELVSYNDIIRSEAYIWSEI